MCACLADNSKMQLSNLCSGVISNISARYMQYLVNDKGWFSCSRLSRPSRSSCMKKKTRTTRGVLGFQKEQRMSNILGAHGRDLNKKKLDKLPNYSTNFNLLSKKGPIMAGAHNEFSLSRLDQHAGGLSIPYPYNYLLSYPYNWKLNETYL